MFCNHRKGYFATTPTKTFSQGREYFFLSVVAKMGCESLSADMRHLLRKFYTTHKNEELNMGLGVGEVLRKDLTRYNTFI